MTKGEVSLSLSKIWTLSEICRNNRDNRLSIEEVNAILPFAKEAKEAIEKVSKYALDNFNSANEEERELSIIICRCLKFNSPSYVSGVDTSVDYLNNLLCSIRQAIMATVDLSGYRDELSQSKHERKREEVSNTKRDEKTQSEVEQMMQSQNDHVAQVEKELLEAQKRISELEAQINNSQQNGNDNPEYIESLNHQLAEEKNKNVELEAEIKHLKEVIELDKELDNDETRLQIDERVILVSTALGTPWNSDMTNQTQLAKIIEHFSGDNFRSIRSRIVAINREMKKELKSPGEGLTQGTKEAVSNVIGWLGKATRGERNTQATDALIEEIKDIFLNTKE